MQSLTDKVVAITGASRGIGFGLAKRFAKEGAKLVICSRSQRRINSAATLLKLPPERLLVMATDISTRAGMARFVRAGYRKFGRVDVFFNNVGVWTTSPIHKLPDREFRRMMDTNLSAVFYSFQELIPRMKKQGGGQIINISSGAGRIPIPKLAVYCATKAALNMLSAATLREVRNDGIKIAILAPGPVTAGTGTRRKNRTGKVTVEQVADVAVSMAMQDIEAHSWMVDVRPLHTDTPFV